MLNKFIIIKSMILAFNILNASEVKSDITEEQKKQIEALTNDLLMASEFELNSMDDDQKKYKLSDLKGSVVILNFWATWVWPLQDGNSRFQ